MLAALLSRHLLQRYAAIGDCALHSYSATRFAQIPPASDRRNSKFLKTRLCRNVVSKEKARSEERAFKHRSGLLLQRRLDRRDHHWRIRRHGRLKASDRLSVARDEELGEVPLDLAADVGRRSEVSVERRLIVALYRDLRHHRKLHVELAAAELSDLCIGAGLLVGEVVRRHADDHQAFVLVLLVDGLERGVLRRKSAGAGDVDHQQYLALVGAKRGRVTVDSAQFELVDG